MSMERQKFKSCLHNVWMTRYGRPQHLLESIVTSPNDEWPIHPDNEWPVRPDPEAEKALYVPPDETEQANNAVDEPKKRRITARKLWQCAGLTAATILAFVIAYVTDIFGDDTTGLAFTWFVVYVLWIINILIDDTESDKANEKRVREAKPRRALITDDMQSVIIDLSKHKDSQVPDGEWPVLKQEDLKPTFEPYEPDKSEEPYWPHLPLSEEPTYYQRIRRITWVTGCFMLITTVFTTIITFIYPDEAGYPDVAIFFAVVSGVCFVIAYSEQLFIGGDH
jgi:hypothetical protein